MSENRCSQNHPVKFCTTKKHHVWFCIFQALVPKPTHNAQRVSEHWSPAGSDEEGEEEEEDGVGGGGGGEEDGRGEGWERGHVDPPARTGCGRRANE